MYSGSELNYLLISVNHVLVNLGDCTPSEPRLRGTWLTKMTRHRVLQRRRIKFDTFIGHNIFQFIYVQIYIYFIYKSSIHDIDIYIFQFIHLYHVTGRFSTPKWHVTGYFCMSPGDFPRHDREVTLGRVFFVCGFWL